MKFSIKGKELKKYKKWNKKHKKKCPNYNLSGALGGRLTFSFNPTALGSIIKVTCDCGEEVDITNSENW